jgi:hypothetical protein
VNQNYRALAGVMLLVPIAFVALNGILMLLSPPRYHSFCRWYMSWGGEMVSHPPSGFQLSTRIEGLLLFAFCVFLGSKAALLVTEPQPAVAPVAEVNLRGQNTPWAGAIAGAVTILVGIALLCSPERVARWLDRSGVPHTPDPSAHRLQIRLLGFLAIAAGSFFVYVALKTV